MSFFQDFGWDTFAVCRSCCWAALSVPPSPPIKHIFLFKLAAFQATLQTLPGHNYSYVGQRSRLRGPGCRGCMLAWCRDFRGEDAVKNMYRELDG